MTRLLVLSSIPSAYAKLFIQRKQDGETVNIEATTIVEERILPEMPEGVEVWEERTYKGKKYFANHQTKKTQWEKPKDKEIITVTDGKDEGNLTKAFASSTSVDDDAVKAAKSEPAAAKSPEVAAAKSKVDCPFEWSEWSTDPNKDGWEIAKRDIKCHKGTGQADTQRRRTKPEKTKECTGWSKWIRMSENEARKAFGKLKADFVYEKRKRDSSCTTEDNPNTTEFQTKPAKAAKPEPAADASPKVWLKAKDEKSGRFYYYIEGTTKTQWEEPKVGIIKSSKP